MFVSVALSHAAKSPLYPPLLTADVRQHLTHLVEEYHGLQEKANVQNTVKDHTLYQKMSSLESLVKLIAQLEIKEKVVT
jgi:hypothetical protein